MTEVLKSVVISCWPCCFTVIYGSVTSKTKPKTCWCVENVMSTLLLLFTETSLSCLYGLERPREKVKPWFHGVMIPGGGVDDMIFTVEMEGEL